MPSEFGVCALRGKRLRGEEGRAKHFERHAGRPARQLQSARPTCFVSRSMRRALSASCAQAAHCFEPNYASYRSLNKPRPSALVFYVSTQPNKHLVSNSLPQILLFVACALFDFVPFKINGSVAYAAQRAWIQNATLRDNVLFGSPMDPERYARVLSACALTSDLDLLEAGDQTEIGEKGYVFFCIVVVYVPCVLAFFFFSWTWYGTCLQDTSAVRSEISSKLLRASCVCDLHAGNTFAFFVLEGPAGRQVLFAS